MRFSRESSDCECACRAAAVRGVATRCTAASRRLHTPCFSQALAVAAAAVRWRHNRRDWRQFRARSVRRQHRLRRRPRPPPREQRAVRRSRGRGQQRYRRAAPTAACHRTRAHNIFIGFCFQHDWLLACTNRGAFVLVQSAKQKSF